MITTLPSVVSAVRGGLLRAVAVTGESRSPLFPELPTFAQAGVPGYLAVIHYGMVAPAGLNAAIADRLNRALNAALADAQVRTRIAEEGGEPLPGTREQQAADIDVEETKWGVLVRKLGTKVE
jgi:tripartite-type tricarboxylate transporter receptor subunit TctC